MAFRGPLGAGALAQRLHEIDGRFAWRLGPLRNRLSLELQLDQVRQRALVAVVERSRIEWALLGFDDVNCEIEHLAGDLLGRDVRERLLGRTDLVVEIEGRGGKSVLKRANEKRSDAPEQDRLGDRRRSGPAHAFAHEREGLVGAAVRGRKAIGLVEIEVIDAGQVDECGNREGLVAVRNDRGDFVRLDGDKFVLPDFVALDLIVAFDRLAGLGVDELAANPVARRPVDRMQGDPLARRCDSVEGDRAGHLRDLEEAFPACS